MSLLKPAVSVRNRLTSSSGWTPLSSFRSPLRSRLRRRGIEVFDRSALPRRMKTGSGFEWLAPTVRCSCRSTPVRAPPRFRSSRSSRAPTRRLPRRLPQSAFLAVITLPRGQFRDHCVASAARSGSAQGAKRCIGVFRRRHPPHRDRRSHTEIGNGRSAELTPVCCHLCGYHRWRHRNSGNATRPIVPLWRHDWIRGSWLTLVDRREGCTTRDLQPGSE